MHFLLLLLSKAGTDSVAIAGNYDEGKKAH